MKIENLKHLEEVVTAITYGKHEGDIFIGNSRYIPEAPMKMDKGETVIRLVNEKNKTKEVIARHSKKLKGIKTLNINNDIFSTSLVKNPKIPVQWKRRVNGATQTDSLELANKFDIITELLG